MHIIILMRNPPDSSKTAEGQMTRYHPGVYCKLMRVLHPYKTEFAGGGIALDFSRTHLIGYAGMRDVVHANQARIWWFERDVRWCSGRSFPVFHDATCPVPLSGQIEIIERITIGLISDYSLRLPRDYFLLLKRCNGYGRSFVMG